MYSYLIVGVLLLSLFCSGSIIAQDQQSSSNIRTSSQKPLILEKFRPPTTIVSVRDSHLLRIATTFSLNTPSEYRVRLHPIFHEITERWLEKHPGSLVIEVHYSPLYPNKDITFARNAYVWVRDNGVNLNIELVRQGACNSRTMLLDDEDEKDILVDKRDYGNFKLKILEAEKMAKEERLGIWGIQ